jgi:hypothetical protein
MFDGGAGFDTGERFPVGSEVWHRASIPLSFGRIVAVIAGVLPANRKRPENPLRDGFASAANPSRYKAFIVRSGDRTC